MTKEITHDLGTTRHNPELNHRLDSIGWGLLFMLTGFVWLVPVPDGTWLFGVAAILLGLNLVRYLSHIKVDVFSMVLGIAALIAALSPIWPHNLPLLPLALIIIGALLVAKPLLHRELPS